jgi:hypothetical protein
MVTKKSTLLEHIELGAQGVEQDERRALAGHYVANRHAIYFDVADGNVRRPRQPFRWCRRGSQGFHHVGDQD